MKVSCGASGVGLGHRRALIAGRSRAATAGAADPAAGVAARGSAPARPGRGRSDGSGERLGERRRPTLLTPRRSTARCSTLRAPAFRSRLRGRRTDCSMSRAADSTSLLQPPQLVELHLAVDVGLDLVDVALQPAEQVAEHARGLRQPLGADDDQRDDADDDDFGEADVEHERAGRRIAHARRLARPGRATAQEEPAPGTPGCGLRPCARDPS